MKRTRLRAKRPTKRRSVHPVQPAHHMPVWGPAGSMTPIKLSAEYRGSVDLRKLARGRPCMVRIPSVCNGNTETTILAHYRLTPFSGAGLKPANWMGAWSCSACHDGIDQRTVTGYSVDVLHRFHAEGVFRTLAKLIEEGYINVGI